MHNSPAHSTAGAASRTMQAIQRGNATHLAAASTARLRSLPYRWHHVVVSTACRLSKQDKLKTDSRPLHVTRLTRKAKAQ